MSPTCTAVLFAGGESRRMGTDKALLSVDGQPLWARQLAILSELQPQALIVSARKKPSWCPTDVGVVLDAEPSHGPLSGLASALAQIRTTHLLALAVDLPSMTSAMLSCLWRAAGPGCGAIAVGDRGFEPLAAIYPVEAGPAARIALTGKDHSLQSLVATLCRQGRMASLAIRDSETFLFRNLNTPADLPPA